MIFLRIRPLVTINPTVLELSARPSIMIMLAELLSDRVQIIIEIHVMSVYGLGVVLWLVRSLWKKIIETSKPRRELF